MKADVLVIGGGLGGLAATWQLRQSGVDAGVVEARDRIGGRVFTIRDAGGAYCDLGPSWVWQGQPLVAELLERLGIALFEQYAQGNTVYQTPDGEVHVIPDPSPMAGSLRIEGGVGRLCEALAMQLEPTRPLLQHVVRELRVTHDHVEAVCETPAGEVRIQAGRVALALPPRLAAEISFTPALSLETQALLRSTPTWMAGHAKLFAIYDVPFWRARGLSGTAISRKGPLSEIHDASANSGKGSGLWGFVGLGPEARGTLGRTRLIEHSLTQLVQLFGSEAGAPRAVHYQDWSQEAFTSTPADRAPLAGHPEYGLRPDVGDTWGDRLRFISSETSYTNGGLIEGALEAVGLFVSGIPR